MLQWAQSSPPKSIPQRSIPHSNEVSGESLRFGGLRIKLLESLSLLKAQCIFWWLHLFIYWHVIWSIITKNIWLSFSEVPHRRSRLMGDTTLTSQPNQVVILGYLEKIKSCFGFASQKCLLDELLHITALPFVFWTTYCEIRMLQLILDINYKIFWYLLLLKLQTLHSPNCTRTLSSLKLNYMFLSLVVCKKSTLRKQAHPKRSETK